MVKKTKTGATENEQKDPSWDLSSNKTVTIRSFKGKPFVDIRESFFTKEGTKMPTKKGVTMNAEIWKTFLSLADEIDETFEKVCKEA